MSAGRAFQRLGIEDRKEVLTCRALNEGSLRFPGLSVADLSPC